MANHKYNIDVTKDDVYIYINLRDFDCRIYTEYEDSLFDLVSSTTWTINSFYDSEKTRPRYIYSNKLKQQLHQVVMDFYFGEGACKKAYTINIIVDHLNNNSLDCRISNLYFLHKERNIYKGKYFDKKAMEYLRNFAIKVFHNHINSTFQITIGFSIQCSLSTEMGRPLVAVKFLYKDLDYWNVIQDAETMLDQLISVGKIELNPRLYRYSEYITEFGEYYKVTQDGEVLGIKPGSVVSINGELHIIDPIILEVEKEKEWG